MTLFLRTQKNFTILDVEYYKKEGQLDVRAVIDITQYSKLLLENLERKDEIISTFRDLTDLRGWLWERYFMGEENTDLEYDNVLKELRNILKEAATKFNLYYVED